ncbi:MAG: HPr kinase/phosphatase C-terminal domain-containing protein [Gammaproteobacteria bacterium]|nr:HPr kinase/phosphatase C-terminal domain-containing protein [Gammaproteobacteria bacterium]
MQTVHGTTVAVSGAGVLLQGPSGSGKSDLALRLIDRGAVLVADDRTVIERRDGELIASAPEALRGLLEVRGIGLVRTPAQAAVSLSLAVDLDAPPERLPLPETTSLMGVRLRLLRLSAFDSSAAAKIRLAVGLAPDDIVR